ncbi:MAG: cysteine desulfurase [Endomicrobia bacterium]|nr:cysteine desulfurase [Endomicrobiia bacterium]MDW8055765.1 cysteine desulfurase family protein [Elusimicrobiota bacterium]
MKVYLDNHSATKLDPEVLDEMLPFFSEHYGNAQSIHDLGVKAKDAVEKSRFKVAQLINCGPEEIIFTSCGSESNNLAIKGVALAYKEKGKHIITSAIEHFSVLNSLEHLKKFFGFEYTVLPVDKYGVVNIDEFKNALRDDTVLVSIQLANSEIGTIQPIKKLVSIVKEFNTQKKERQIKTLFHTDAVAACGIIPADVKELDVDLFSLSASQLHGPKGIAALYVRKGVRIIPQIDGGIQEGGRRAGTENVVCIVGMGKAAEITKQKLNENYNKMLLLRDKLIQEVPKRVKYVYLNGHPVERLPNNVNFSFEFIEGESILLLLNQKGIYVSSGSACVSKTLKLSHVLKSIGVDPAVGQGSIVFTLSRYTTQQEVDYVLDQITPIIERLRSISPLYDYFLKTGQRMLTTSDKSYDVHEEEQN